MVNLTGVIVTALPELSLSFPIPFPTPFLFWFSISSSLSPPTLVALVLAFVTELRNAFTAVVAFIVVDKTPIKDVCTTPTPISLLKPFPFLKPILDTCLETLLQPTVPLTPTELLLALLLPNPNPSTNTNWEPEAEISVCASYHAHSLPSIVTVPTSLYLDEPAPPPTSLRLTSPNPASELNDPTLASGV
ncbi:hypothetical protein BJ165DRAFT_1532636 [Panaeolus papilionaceus]|nr:hypothetical protein BJ165DRAFT_1532636 [Panaeolus papilionaceus]